MNSAPMQAVALELGPGNWDGSATISAGAIVKIQGAHLGPNDRINDDHSWQIARGPSWGSIWAIINPKEIPPETFANPMSITIYYRAPESATLRVKLKKERTISSLPYYLTNKEREAMGLRTTVKEFDFRPADLPESAPLPLLGGQVYAFRVPPEEQISTADYHNNHPSLTADNTGNVWIAWIAYRDESEDILLRRLINGSWSEPVKVSEKSGDFFSSAVAVDGRGLVWVVWSERNGYDWHLMARAYDGSSWRPAQRLTDGAGNNLFHRLTADHNGNLHLVWQGFRGGRSDIFLKSLTGDSWSREFNLSDSNKDERCNDWMPAVTVDHSGTAWVAWDSYASGSYNILLRPVQNGKPGKLFHVTNSLRFHAHASLAVDGQDRLWIAWDESEENWGKDVGFLFEGGTGLYQSRRIRFAILSDGRWLEPRDDLNQRVAPGIREFVATPRLIPDRAGRIWMIFRPRVCTGARVTRYTVGAAWKIMASYYSGDRWSAPITIPESSGWAEGPFDVAAGGERSILIAWVTDYRHRAEGGMNNFVKSDIFTTSISTMSSAPMDLGPRSTEPPAHRPLELHEKEQIDEVRNYSLQIGGKTYRIYRGDLHRHTDISCDGQGDGSIWDCYRYLLDAANLDFGMVTDHDHERNLEYWEYPWWRTEKTADMFHIPGFFIPLLGYELGVEFPNGHRNLVFAHRGVRRLPPLSQEEVRGIQNIGATLYPYLKKNQGISIPHTSSTTNMGTADWRDNDPELEPLVEIFQGARTSAEHEGAPLAPAGTRPDLRAGEAGGYQSQGWVWKAWAKGYKLGVIASSDHVSTHCSYACILAEEGTREGLLDAMRRRHTYAATSNIIMDFRLRDTSGEYLMGDAVLTRDLPELLVKIIGTAPIRKADVIRDNQYIYSRQGSGTKIEFRYREETLTKGKHYYYVRMEQVDGHVAWASPIWVEYRS